jgi:Lrp/AsnC family leucine-responsive transcriptional regulator
MAPSGVLERVRKLEKQGIIDGYEVRLNPARFDRGLVAFIFVRPQPDSDPSGLGKALAAVADVQEVHFIAGEDGLMVKVRVADTAHLERVRREKIAALPQVRSTRTLVALHTYKESARIPLDDAAIQKLKKKKRRT